MRPFTSRGRVCGQHGHRRQILGPAGTRHAGGRITIGIAVLQDVAVIIFLGLQPALDSPSFTVVAHTFLRIGALIGLTLGVSKYLLPPLFRRVATLPELVVVGALAWCFIIAAVANQLNLSREMGALVAGVASRPSLPPRRDGEGDEPARFLHHPVLRRPRSHDPASRSGTGADRVAGVRLRDRQPDPDRHGALPPRARETASASSPR
jgi:hypothetical protein